MDKDNKTFQERLDETEKSGEVIGKLLANTYTTLIKEGISEDNAAEMAKSVVRGGNSVFDGQCGG